MDTLKLRHGGFTLIEVLIAVVIVAILAALALPSYQEQVRKTKRSDGKGFLLEIAAAQERYFTQNVSYVALNTLGYSSATPQSPEGYYTVTYTALNGGQGFSLSAAPRAPFADSECGSLTLTNTGLRGSSSGNADDCWD